MGDLLAGVWICQFAAAIAVCFVHNPAQQAHSSCRARPRPVEVHIWGAVMSTILKNCGITLAILLIFGCSKQPQPTAQIGAHVSLNPEPVVQRASRLDLVLSDNEIKQMLISRSLASYPGNCPCPHNLDRAGRRCGKRSAYLRPGGASPLCYESDVTPEMVAAFRYRLSSAERGLALGDFRAAADREAGRDCGAQSLRSSNLLAANGDERFTPTALVPSATALSCARATGVFWASGPPCSSI